MIAPLRRLHRWVFIGLAVVLPVLVFLALLARPPQVPVVELPPFLVPADPAAPGPVVDAADDLLAPEEEADQ